MVKNPPSNSGDSRFRRFKVQSLHLEDFLEKEMATHSSILAWQIPWAKEPDGLQSIKLGRVGHD